MCGSRSLLLLAAVTVASFCAAAETASAGDSAISADEIGPRFVIYGDAHGRDFVPSGWMPDGRGLAQDTRCSDQPYSGKFCLRTKCRLADATEGWAGIAWLLDGQWEPRRAFNLFSRIGAKAGDPVVLRFWARSNPGAWIEFSSGGGNGDSIDRKQYVDRHHAALDRRWQRFQIDLTGCDLSNVVQLFASTANFGSAPLPLDFDKLHAEISRLPAASRRARLDQVEASIDRALATAVAQWDLDEAYVVRLRTRPTPPKLDEDCLEGGPPWMRSHMRLMELLPGGDDPGMRDSEPNEGGAIRPPENQ